MYSSLFERLVANTQLADPDDPSSCWLWTGSVNPSSGYPRLTIRVPGCKHPVRIYAHRAMLEEHHDIEFPFDEAGHLCYQPLCINPQHLEVQTQAHNLSDRRGFGPVDGCMIPTLFPRNEDIERRLDDWFEGRYEAAQVSECPF